ncbi:hypothetical protein D3C78_512970 [compost metagenome]
MVTHQGHQATLDLRRLEDLGLVAFHLAGQLALLLGQRSNAHLCRAHLGAHAGDIEADRGGRSRAIATGFERLDPALDRHHIGVGFLVAAQQPGILGLQAGQVLGLLGTGHPGAFAGLGGKPGIGRGQFQLKVTQLFLGGLVITVDLAELQL